MKKLLLIIGFTFAVFCIKSQTISFTGGDKLVGLTAGYGTSLYKGGEWSLKMPPVSIVLDYCIVDSIGKMKQAIGVGLMGTMSKTQFLIAKGTTKEEGVNYTIYSAGLRTTYHVYTKKKNNIYGGLIFWYISPSGELFGNSSDLTKNPVNKDNVEQNKGFKVSFFAGWRYYLNKQVSIFAEAEYKVTWLNAGICFRFR